MKTIYTHNMLSIILAVMLLQINKVHSIVGGHTTVPGKAPYIVAVRADLSFICAGVLIKSNWVLTTAQCVNDKTVADVSVLAGSHRLLTNKNYFTVSRIVINPAYDVTLGAHNLALLHLSEAILITARTNTIVPNDVAIKSGTVTIFYGWGSLAYGSTSYSNNLQTLFQRTISMEECRTMVASLADGEFCAKAQEGQAACTKDEGGPLVDSKTGKLLGVYSYGTQCTGRVPDIFVDVYQHKPWIDTIAI